MTENAEAANDRREHNKAVVRRFFEALNNRDRGRFVSTLADDITYGSQVGPEARADGEWRWIEAMDLTAGIQSMHANEEYVTTRAIARGTHRGEILGLDPTGESFEVSTMSLARIEDGLIAEWWGQWEFASLLNQIGVPDSPVYDD